jgi:hypothetical protein
VIADACAPPPAMHAASRRAALVKCVDQGRLATPQNISTSTYFSCPTQPSHCTPWPQEVIPSELQFLAMEARKASDAVLLCQEHSCPCWYRSMLLAVRWNMSAGPTPQPSCRPPPASCCPCLGADMS